MSSYLGGFISGLFRFFTFWLIIPRALPLIPIVVDVKALLTVGNVAGSGDDIQHVFGDREGLVLLLQHLLLPLLHSSLDVVREEVGLDCVDHL
jgi:hypothetical protein